jgi:hypothetical protein
MEPKLTITYDRIGDILSIDRCQPYIGQESEMLDNEIVVRLNPKTGAVENLEILFFNARLEKGEAIELPFNGDLLLAETE